MENLLKRTYSIYILYSEEAKWNALAINICVNVTLPDSSRKAEKITTQLPRDALSQNMRHPWHECFPTFMGSGLAHGRWWTELVAVPSFSAINGLNLYTSKALAVLESHLFISVDDGLKILIYISGKQCSIIRETFDIEMTNSTRVA